MYGMYFVRPVFVLLLVATYLLAAALTFIQPHQIAYAAQFELFQFSLLLAVMCICLRIVARRFEKHTGGGR